MNSFLKKNVGAEADEKKGDLMKSDEGNVGAKTDEKKVDLKNSDERNSAEKTGGLKNSEEKMGGLKNSEEVKNHEFDARKKRLLGAEGLYKQLELEAEELKEIYPDFDLEEECRNRAFIALISTGVSLREAYEAAHHREILEGAMAYTARQVAEAVWKSIESGASRPSENGLSSKGIVRQKKSTAKMTDAEIKNILKRVQNGEKVRF